MVKLLEIITRASYVYNPISSTLQDNNAFYVFLYMVQN